MTIFVNRFLFRLSVRRVALGQIDILHVFKHLERVKQSCRKRYIARMKVHDWYVPVKMFLYTSCRYFYLHRIRLIKFDVCCNLFVGASGQIRHTEMFFSLSVVRCFRHMCSVSKGWIAQYKLCKAIREQKLIHSLWFWCWAVCRSFSKCAYQHIELRLLSMDRGVYSVYAFVCAAHAWLTLCVWMIRRWWGFTAELFLPNTHIHTRKLSRYKSVVPVVFFFFFLENMTIVIV